MTRIYLTRKHLELNPDLYNGYSYLILYADAILPRGDEIIKVYGFFLSDLPRPNSSATSNEIHFPILFTDQMKAIKLFTKLQSHKDIKEFEHSLERLVEHD